MEKPTRTEKVSTVTLRGNHLAGGKPIYPNHCVLCDQPSEDFFLMPVAVSGGVLRDLFRTGELHRIPVHAGRCRNMLKRDFFARRQLPCLLMVAYLVLLMPVAFFLGAQYFAMGIIALLPIAVIQAWVDYKKPVLFEARLETDNWGRGLLTVEVQSEGYAKRFAKMNARAVKAETE